MDKKPVISLRAATVGYKKPGRQVPVLEQLNLDFHIGDFIGVAGMNGRGKSTLLKSICGLLPVLKGEILVEGSGISTYSLGDMAKKIAIVLTEKLGGFNLTAFDAVAAGQIPYTNSFHQLRREHINMIEEAMAACGVTGYRDKLLSELSDGQFQKTMIARALAQQTPVMLLDEPSAFLDYASKHDLFMLMQGLAAGSDKCILVSSHDLDLILKYCNKLLVIGGDSVELIPVSAARENQTFMAIGGGFI